MPTLSQQIQGKVIHGDQVGRTIGFPTANLDVTLTEKDLPLGVYFGECFLESEPDKKYWCLPYFGPRFIFGEQKNSFEVYIYDFDQQIYDQVLHVTMMHKIRAPIDIKSLEQLQQQLTQDKKAGEKYMAKEYTEK